MPAPVAPVAHAPLLLDLPPLHWQFAGAAPVFSGLRLALPAGVHALRGESGSGKTSLLRLLAGDLGRLTDRPGLSARTRQTLAAACWIDSRDPDLDGLTPEGVCRRVASRHPELDMQRWQQHIDGFALAPHAAKTLHMLSTGMRRKAVLAAQLASGADLLLLDEPFAGLDRPSAGWLVAALNAIGAGGRCVVLLAAGDWPEGLQLDGAIDLPPPGAG